MRKSVLVVGAKGQLGFELTRNLKAGKSEMGVLNSTYRNFEVLEIGHQELDISDQAAVFELICKTKPYAVVNCGAFTDVDGCEIHSEIAFKVNAVGPRNLAMACENVGAKFVQISTDYVFDGTAKKPRIESDQLNPQSIYGKSKAFGEQYSMAFCRKFFIIRTSWLYGVNGKNFVKTIVKVAKDKGFLRVVDDQIGNPTNVCDLSWHILKLILTDYYGIYHCTGNGECSWFDFASEIVKVFKIKAVVEACTSSEFKRPAKRPAYSSLDNFMLRLSVGDECRNWQDALASFAAGF